MTNSYRPVQNDLSQHFGTELTGPRFELFSHARAAQRAGREVIRHLAALDPPEEVGGAPSGGADSEAGDSAETAAAAADAGRLRALLAEDWLLGASEDEVAATEAIRTRIEGLIAEGTMRVAIPWGDDRADRIALEMTRRADALHELNEALGAVLKARHDYHGTIWAMRMAGLDVPDGPDPGPGA